jgi:transposase
MRKLEMIEISEILYRWSKGIRIKGIAKSLGYARNSVKSIIKQAEALGLRFGFIHEQFDQIVLKLQAARYLPKVSAQSQSKVSMLTAYDERIATWLNQKSMTLRQIHRLITESGLSIGETSLRRYVYAKFQSQLKLGKNYTVPLFTAPAEEAQVDYGYVGLMLDRATGNLRKTYAFVMTMAYSRYRYVEFSFKQDVKSWVESHINAFRFFGGVPKRILLDNLKAGVIKADIYDPTINKTYAEFERFFNFVVDPAKVRTPEHKGKVERSVLIVKQQLIAGRQYEDLITANEKALDWCQNIIAKKITRTTGKAPAELFTEEQPLLTKLPEKSFDISKWVMAKCHRDHHIVFEGNFYSLPTNYINYEVAVRGGFRTVEIYYDNKLIKTHLKLEGRGQWQTDHDDYPEAVLRFLKKTPEKCLAEAKIVGEATAEVVKIILLRPSKQKLRKVQAIIRLQDKYSKERLENACLKSLMYENYCYATIRNMLAKNIEQLTVEESPMVHYSSDYSEAYVRPANQYTSSMEAHNGR